MTTIDPAALRRFADELRTSAGLFTEQCGTPCTTALASASGAIAWPDGAAHLFGQRWDQEIALLGAAIWTVTRGFDDVIDAYGVTESALGGG